MQEQTQALVDDLFDMLGWKLKVQKPFSAVFDALGVTFDLKDSMLDKFVIANKVSRVEEIVKSVNDIVVKGFLPAAIARSLRGRIQFSGAQVFGRAGAAALRTLGSYADGHSHSPLLNDDTAMALKWLCRYLENSRPRTVFAWQRRPVIIFTDGACEPDGQGVLVTIGAVLFMPESGVVQYFGTTVPPSVTALWSDGGKSQLVGQAELLPVLLAKTTWCDYITGLPVIYFIDNNSARFSLITGASPVLQSLRIIHEGWLLDAASLSLPWYARVPSVSNVADYPSRLQFDLMRMLSSCASATRVQPVTPASWGSDVWSALKSRLTRDFW
jgi:hypothetical protein